MNRDRSEAVPEQIAGRVHNTSDSFIGREQYLLRKYQTGNKTSGESPKAIQKEIDGMARLLCAIATEEQSSEDIEQYLNIYDDLKRDLIDLEHQIIEICKKVVDIDHLNLF